jgi:hypothetical protein
LSATLEIDNLDTFSTKQLLSLAFANHPDIIESKTIAFATHH